MNSTTNLTLRIAMVITWVAAAILLAKSYQTGKQLSTAGIVLGALGLILLIVVIARKK